MRTRVNHVLFRYAHFCRRHAPLALRLGTADFFINQFNVELFNKEREWVLDDAAKMHLGSSARKGMGVQVTDDVV